MNILAIIILITIYILSIASNWIYLRIAYSSGGRWYNLDITGIEVILTFFPFFNTICGIVNWLSGSPKDKNSSYLNKIFLIKK